MRQSDSLLQLNQANARMPGWLPRPTRKSSIHAGLSPPVSVLATSPSIKGLSVMACSSASEGTEYLGEACYELHDRVEPQL